MQTEAFGAELKRLGFCDFVGVPCSYLAPLINWAINENVFVMANNEGEAVAIASGVSLVSALPLSDKSGSASARFVNEPQSSISSLTSHNPDFSSQMLPHDNINQRNDFENSAASKDSPSLAEGARGWVNSTIESTSDSRGSILAQKDNAHRYGVVLMQNSGLSNALSPLTSLNHTFEIPILGFVSLRGEPNQAGQNTDEPQHELLGKITDKLLQICDIECAFLDSRFEVACEQLAKAQKVLESNKSFFFIVRNSCFEKVALTNNPLDFSKHDLSLRGETKTIQNFCHTEHSEVSQKKQRDSSPTAQNDKDNATKDNAPKPTRLQALQIIQNIGTNCALLATTGKCGRELYELGDKPNQLYMVGSMGCVSALGLGVALKSRKKVIAIDGDSALLMRLGTLSGNAYYARCANKGNFCHILLDNQSHDSTGGQFNLSPFVDFVAIAKSCGYAVARGAKDLSEFSAILREFMSSESGGAWFIYLKIAKGSKKDLGRPKITPKQVAQRFSAWLNED